MDGWNLLYSGEMMFQSEQNVRNGGEMVLTKRTGEGKTSSFTSIVLLEGSYMWLDGPFSSCSFSFST